MYKIDATRKLNRLIAAGGDIKIINAVVSLI